MGLLKRQGDTRAESSDYGVGQPPVSRTGARRVKDFSGSGLDMGKPFNLNGELAGARTQDPRLKRALLYLLSYELVYIFSRNDAP